MEASFRSPCGSLSRRLLTLRTGTFIRAQLYEQFASDIDAAYVRFESDTDGKDRKLQLGISELEQWLLNKFVNDLGIHLPDADADIFAAGVDSLQTTRLWRMLKKDLDLGAGSGTLTQNIVFEKGTVRKLAKHLFQLRMGSADQSDDNDNEIEVMRGMIERYSTFTKHFPTRSQPSQRHVVLLTGATGNLGAFVLAEMAKSDNVGEVWALVRAPGHAAAGARLMNSLAARSIKLSNEQSSKVRAVSSNLDDPNLGLATYDLEHLLDTLTCVVHSAWAVNFNLGVRSFEQHIRGAHNLINLCLRSRLLRPASFFFCSSVSAAGGTPKPATIAETAVENLNYAQKMGYGRSKLVTEHITRNAMQKAGMHARVLRIGQLSGDSVSADWNETEAIPLMVRSALTTGALPRLDERPSWLPVDACAKAIVEMALPHSGIAGTQANDTDLVYHLINPRTFSFEQDLLPKLKIVMPDFEIIEPSEWLSRLARSDSNVEENPSIKLLDFWRGKYGSPSSHSEPAALTFETTRTEHDAPSLTLVKDPVSDGLIERYVEVWLRKWLE